MPRHGRIFKLQRQGRREAKEAAPDCPLVKEAAQQVATRRRREHCWTSQHQTPLPGQLPFPAPIGSPLLYTSPGRRLLYLEAPRRDTSKQHSSRSGSSPALCHSALRNTRESPGTLPEPPRGWAGRQDHLSTSDFQPSSPEQKPQPGPASPGSHL